MSPRTREQVFEWARKQRHRKLSGAQIDALDSVFPGWRDTREDRWLSVLAEVETFVATSGRRPLPSSADSAEKRLGTWLYHYGSKAERGLLPDDRLTAWRSAAIGSPRSRGTWADGLEYLADFVRLHGRLPKLSATEPGEKRAYIWLMNTRRESAGLTADRRTTLDARVPGWDLTLDGAWQGRLEECVQFIQKNGRLPSFSKSGSPEERRCATWIFDQRRKKNPKPERVVALDEQLPGWRD